MDAMEELSQLSESMMQAAALLADEDVEEASAKRTSTFLNVVVLGNVVSFGFIVVHDPLLGFPLGSLDLGVLFQGLCMVGYLMVISVFLGSWKIGGVE